MKRLMVTLPVAACDPRTAATGAVMRPATLRQSRACHGVVRARTALLQSGALLAGWRWLAWPTA